MKQAQNVIEKRKHRANIGSLLSTLLVKYHTKKDLTLEVLLKFRLWPEYLRSYGKSGIIYH